MSREVRRRSFQGPGESLDSNGEGKGVTSPMADIIGLPTVELAPECEPKMVAMLPVLTLGVLEIGRSDEAEVLCCRLNVGRFDDLEGVESVLLEVELSAQVGDSWLRSVWTRRAAVPPEGLCGWGSEGPSLEAASGEDECGGGGGGGGGDGAMVSD